MIPQVHCLRSKTPSCSRAPASRLTATIHIPHPYSGNQKIPLMKMKLGIKDAQILSTLFLNEVHEDKHHDNRSFNFQ